VWTCRYLSFRRNILPPSSDLKRGIYPGSPHGVTNQKTHIDIFSAARTSDLIQWNERIFVWWIWKDWERGSPGCVEALFRHSSGTFWCLVRHVKRVSLGHFSCLNLICEWESKDENWRTGSKCGLIDRVEKI
jgi:hypothetical protein